MGSLVAFLPFLILIFVISFWNTAKTAFFVYLGGLVLMCIGIAIAPGWIAGAFSKAKAAISGFRLLFSMASNKINPH